MKWRETLLNADINMSAHARTKGTAKIEIYYYGEKSGVVRKRLVANPQEISEHYDKGIDED